MLALTERQKAVLCYFFGIGLENAMSLEDIGDHFNLTRERVRQIEAKALKKLRHPTRSKRLQAFLDLIEAS